MSMKNVIGNLLRTVELPRMVIELVSFSTPQIGK